MAIISISGKINSGKDTVGKIIQGFSMNKNADYEWIEKFYTNSHWQIKKFADTLKDIVCLLLNCTREQLEDREFKEKELGEEWDKYVIKNLNSHNIISPYFTSKEEAQKWEQSQDWYEDTGGYDTSAIKVKLTPRLLLQLLGTECGRQIIHPSIWCISLFSNYTAEISENFLNMSVNEAKEKGFLIVLDE
jgi:hypothetical protein